MSASLTQRVMALFLVSAFACRLEGDEVEPEPRDQKSRSEEVSGIGRKRVIEALGEQLRRYYIFPETADQIGRHLDQERKSGVFREMSSKAGFAEALTRSIRSICDDSHLMVRVIPENVAANSSYSESFLHQRGAGGNYGFQELRILPGNVGYLRLTSFSLDELFEESKPTVAAAMNFLANSNSVIIDLRGNGGGSARLPAYLASYFFDREPVLINTFHLRHQRRMLECWTTPDAPGARLTGVDLYLLIDEHTFSAAEGFAYSLKHLGRATVVGIRSAGGSHGGAMRPLDCGLEAYIPHSRSIHPVTKTDYEGVGVVPHVEVESEKALARAREMALRASLVGSESDSDRECLQQALETVGSEDVK